MLERAELADKNNENFQRKSIQEHEAPKYYDCMRKSAYRFRGYAATYKTPHYGRSGNKIPACQKMIIYALNHMCDISLPADLIPEWSPDCIFFQYRFLERSRSKVNCDITKSGRE